MPSKEWRQFVCWTCPGKYPHYECRIWYKKRSTLIPEAAKSECHNCGKMVEAVERGKERGVINCIFSCQCSDIDMFVVHCERSDSADCHQCGEWLDSIGFRPFGKIKRKPGSTNNHSCSKCEGKGDCPNKKWRPPKPSQSSNRSGS